MKLIGLTGFAGSGNPDLNAVGWEEFFWKGDSFGFHVRRVMQTYMNRKIDENFLEDVLNQIVFKK